MIKGRVFQMYRVIFLDLVLISGVTLSANIFM